MTWGNDWGIGPIDGNSYGAGWSPAPEALSNVGGGYLGGGIAPNSPYGDASDVDPNGWFNSQGMVPSRSPQMQQGMMPGYFGNLPQGMGMLSPAALAVLQNFFPMMNPNAPTQSYQTNPAKEAQFSTSDLTDPNRQEIQPAQPATSALTSMQTPELFSAQAKGQAQSTGGWEALMAFMGDIIGQQAKQSWLQQSMAAQPSANKANQPNWNVPRQR